MIDLRDPRLAALLAWLVPGAGHLYQRRWPKAALFFVCILGTFLYGMVLGECRVVYASWRPNDRRLQFVCQLGVGLPSLPAVIEWVRERNGKPPLFGGCYRAPLVSNSPNIPDELDQLNRDNPLGWDLGTVYTMIAGLLNLLAIYDAYAGPAHAVPAGRTEEKRPPPARK